MTEPTSTNVLFLHGLGQTPQDWYPQVRAMPSGWQARTPWLAGLEPNAEPGFVFNHAVGALAGLLDAEGVERTHVCGLSLGAMVAIRFAAEHPDRVARLVVSGVQLKASKFMMGLQTGGIRRASEEKLAKKGIDKARVLAVMEALTWVDLKPDLPRITAPTIVVVGNSDRAGFTPARRTSRGIPGAKMVGIKGGHRVNADYAAEFNRSVFGFLATGSVPKKG